MESICDRIRSLSCTYDNKNNHGFFLVSRVNSSLNALFLIQHCSWKLLRKMLRCLETALLICVDRQQRRTQWIHVTREPQPLSKVWKGSLIRKIARAHCENIVYHTVSYCLQPIATTTVTMLRKFIHRQNETRLRHKEGAFGLDAMREVNGILCLNSTHGHYLD